MSSASGLIKLIGDIKNEKTIWHNSGGGAAVVEQAWNRVGEKNKMSGPHAKSIYGVLCKKYDQEKTKGNSKWQLYQHLTFQDVDFGSRKYSKESTPDRSEDEFEEDGEFIELLEVNEEEEQIDSRENLAEIEKHKIIQQIKNSTIKKQEDKDEKSEKKIDELIGQKTQLTKVNSPQIIKMLNAQKKQQNVDVIKPELKKLPGITIIRQTPQNKDSPQSSSTSTPVVRQLTKVITKPKQINISAAKSIMLKQQQQTQENKLQEKEHQKSLEQTILNGDHKSEETKIPSFENFLKRKIVPVTAAAVIENGKQLHREEELSAPSAAKRIALSNKEIKSIEIKSEPLSEVKTEMESEQKEQNFNKITYKKSQSIGSMRDHDDFYGGEENYDENEYGDVTSEESFLYESYDNKRKNNKNDVLPKFFRDLYKSKKYDSFGMYVSSALNRLPKNLAKQLELNILQSIIDVNSLNKD